MPTALEKLNALDQHIKAHTDTIRTLEDKKVKHYAQAIYDLLGVGKGGFVKMTNRYSHGVGKVYQIVGAKKTGDVKLHTKLPGGAYPEQESINYATLRRGLYADDKDGISYFKLEVATAEEIALYEGCMQYLDITEEMEVASRYGIADEKAKTYYWREVDKHPANPSPTGRKGKLRASCEPEAKDRLRAAFPDLADTQWTSVSLY